MFMAPEHNTVTLPSTRDLSIKRSDNSFTGETMRSPDSGRLVGTGNLRLDELANLRPNSRKATGKLVTAPTITAVISTRKYRCCRFIDELWSVLSPRLVASARYKSFVAVTAAATSSIWTTFSPASEGNDHLCSSDEALNERSSDAAAINTTAVSKYRPHVSVLVLPRKSKIKEKARTLRVLKMKRRASSLFSRMTAAIALIGTALLSSHGVGASSIAEETCTGVTLYYTELELEASPRLDTSTEAVAVGIDGTVIASQSTYDRLLLDREAIVEMSEVDVPFRNRWSDRLWLGTVKVTFTGAATLANLEEGSPPDFNCMNEHYGMSFVKGDAGSDIAEGTLTSEKVLNWDLLELEYMSIEGITGFEPTSELVVRSTTNLVATREDLVPNGGRNRSYHYFLSLPSSEVDLSTCPDPCTGEIITYYWSYTGGNVYELDKTSSDADPPACWLSVFEEVSDGPPFGGPTSWDLNCTTTLLNRVEKERTSQIFDESHSGGGRSSEAIAAVAAGVLVPIVIVACIGVVILLQRRQKARKMRTTDEAWGEGRGGWREQHKAPGPLTGKLEVGPIDGGDDSPTLGPPTRAFTDISIGSEEFEGGRRSQSDCCSEVQLERADTGSRDMVYPQDV